MLKVAITGGVACGKSRVGFLLAEEGVPICDADDLVHQSLRSGGEVYRDVLARFGKKILGGDGEIDRRALGKIVFADKRMLAALNSIVHPKTRNAWKMWLAKRESSSKLAAVIVPLLYEIDDANGWDAVVCVAASKAIQLQRLAERGIGRDEMPARLDAQMSVREKMERSDYVIFNDGDEGLLKRQTVMVLNRILER